MLRAEVGLVLGCVRPGFEEVSILEEGIEATEAQSQKDAAGEGAAAFAGDEDVGAGGAFGVGQRVVFLHDELAAQRNHEEDAQPSADKRQHEDARVLEIEAEKDERRQREDDARSDGLAGVAGGLDDVVFEDRGTAKGAQDADGEHGDGNGGGDGEPGAQADVDRDRSEDDAEDGAEKQRAEGELGAVLVGRNEGLKLGHGCLQEKREGNLRIGLKGEFSTCSAADARHLRCGTTLADCARMRESRSPQP